MTKLVCSCARNAVNSMYDKARMACMPVCSSRLSVMLCRQDMGPGECFGEVAFFTGVAPLAHIPSSSQLTRLRRVPCGQQLELHASLLPERLYVCMVFAAGRSIASYACIFPFGIAHSPVTTNISRLLYSTYESVRAQVQDWSSFVMSLCAAVQSLVAYALKGPLRVSPLLQS